MASGQNARGGGDGNARRIALGCEEQILVSLRALGRKVNIFGHSGIVKGCT